MEKIIILLLCSLCWDVQVSAYPKKSTESFVLRYLEDRPVIPVKIEFDTERQTEYLSSITGKTLYDFNQGKVAFKDINSSQCFIADIIEESLEADRRRIKNLQNGIIRGFYLPTLTIQEELPNGTDLQEILGFVLTAFCKENTVSLVQQNRRKRDTRTGQEGHFTHHSYGHHGHLANNYAHYGHETSITGAVDKDGEIRNHQVSQNQVKSEGSQVYPGSSFRNEPEFSSANSRMGVKSPQTRTQYQVPAHQQIPGGESSHFGAGSSGQFSLQSTLEGGYQLKLPLGLQAGNVYRGGVRSTGVGGPQPYLTTDYQKHPSSILSSTYQPFGQYGLRHPLPSVSSQLGVPYPLSIPRQTSLIPEDPRKINGRTVGTLLPRYPDTDQLKLSQQIPGITDTGIETSPTLSRTQIFAPIAPTVTRDERPGRQISDLQPSALQPESSISASGLHIPPYQTGVRPPQQVPGRIIKSSLGDPGLISTGIPGPQFTGIGLHPGSSVSVPGIQTTVYHPAVRMPSIHMPGRPTQNSLGAPGQFLTELQESKTIEMHPAPGISRPSYQFPSLDSDFRHQQQNEPGSDTPDEHYLKISGIRYPTDQGIGGSMRIRPETHALYPSSYPSFMSTDRSGVSGLVQPSQVSTGPGLPQSTLPGAYPRYDETVRSGTQYLESSYPLTRTGIGRESGHITSHISRISEDSKRKDMRTGDVQYLSTDRGPFPQDMRNYEMPTALRQRVSGSPDESRIPSNIPIQNRRIITGQTGLETSRVLGQDSASSQTQIQTGFERTAAEASAAGQYRGLGSQSQVQGGYAGNGSFSAQAQSGFTEGAVQSQIQGSKQGGLSDSSAQIEQVGSVQSQVQVGQPIGSASSSSQGRFTGGITQVQAKGGKSGGSAGAQSQSVGLSSSHVQVNVGGKDANEQEQFQGMISASVHGGHTSGQSQTQLQGGYNSGRTYTATAQGGFDSSLGFYRSVPSVGLFPRFSNQTSTGRLGTASGPESLRTTDGRIFTAGNSSFGQLSEHSLVNEGQISQTRLGSRNQIGGQAAAVYTDQPRAMSNKVPFQAGQPQPSSFPESGNFPQQHLTSSITHPTDSRTPHHSLTQEKQMHSQGSFSHFTDRHSYPHQTGIPGDARSQTRPRENPLYIPGLRETTDLQDLLYPPSNPLPYQHSIFQQPNETSRIPISYPVFTSQPSGYPSTSPKSPHSTFDLRPRYPPTLEAPKPGSLIQQKSEIPISGLQHQPGERFQPQSSLLPNQLKIKTPGSQLIPAQIGQMPVSTRPDGSRYHDFTPGLHQLPSVTGYHQIKPEQTEISTQAQPELPQTALSKSQTATKALGTTIPALSGAADTVQGLPGIAEHDRSNCCGALRDLKRRCCGRTSKDGTSQCCKPGQEDKFDMNLEDNLDQSKEPCKVVKAICYIVYKPVGKARICKPTSTNQC